MLGTDTTKYKPLVPHGEDDAQRLNNLHVQGAFLLKNDFLTGRNTEFDF